MGRRGDVGWPGSPPASGPSAFVAAGAMRVVIASETVPETAREETKTATTVALLAGFLEMMSLDVVLG